MGWCSAFGPQIREGCDHAMVAGKDSCSCADCGAVCLGLFKGCAHVWAAGPRSVVLTRPTSGQRSLVPISATPVEAATEAVRSTPAGPAVAAGAAAVVAAGAVVPADAGAVGEVTAAMETGGEPDDRSDIRALRDDVDLLLWKVDQLQQAAVPLEQMAQAASKIEAAAAALPDQVTEAVSSALQTQRRAMTDAVVEMQRRIVIDVGELLESVRPEVEPKTGGTASPDKVASVADLDARFQWLVDAVSRRFVDAGDDLAQIERRLMPEDHEDYES
jgi:hypothetical protein